MTNEDTAILVVDDDFSVRDSLCSWFRQEGYRVGAAENAAEALRLLQDAAWDLLLVDIRMPGMDGLELQEKIRRVNPETIVVIITAYASVQTAVQALKDGAADYITKPIDPDQLTHVVRKAIEQQRLKTENLRLRESIHDLTRRDDIVGETAAMRRVAELTHRAAETDAPVLISGAPGTGRQHVARAVHANGRRRYFPFVPVSCGAVREGEWESEFFGHERGAVPAAQYHRKGKLEMADGGTLFLDEIALLPPGAQVALSGVLETREFARLGGRRPVRVDIRPICATSHDPLRLLEEGTLREDFYYRINVVGIDLPPLRERREDIPLLARHLLRRYAGQLNPTVTDFDREAMAMLVGHDWPGNVRELANAIERAVALGRGPLVGADDLAWRPAPPSRAPGGDSLAEIEKAHITRVLRRTGGDTARTAEILGIGREELSRRIEEHGLRE